MVERPFLDLAKMLQRLESTTKRNKKISIIAEFLLGLDKEEIAPAVLLTIGYIFPESLSKTLDVSGATIRKVLKTDLQVPLIPQPLTITHVRKTFDEIASAKGKGSRQLKERLLEGLFSQVTGDLESRYLLKNIFGEMQLGVVEGIMIEAIAEAAGIEVSLVRRANMLLGDLGQVALIALTQGSSGLQKIGIDLFHPVKPMLAENALDIRSVIEEHGGLSAFEYKLDGARIQIHKKGNRVKIFSRRLTEVTGSLPEIVRLVEEKVKAEEFLVEGEVVAVGRNGKPLPFQELMRRFKRVHAVEEAAVEIPLQLHLFDILYLN